MKNVEKFPLLGNLLCAHLFQKVSNYYILRIRFLAPFSCMTTIESSQSELLTEIVGSTPTTLWAGQVGVVAVTRLVEANYGDFTADAFKSAAETYLQTLGTDTDLPVIAVENGGA